MDIRSNLRNEFRILRRHGWSVGRSNKIKHFHNAVFPIHQTDGEGTVSAKYDVKDRTSAEEKKSPFQSLKARKP